MTAPVALTCGDPAGIATEITIKAWHALRDQIPLVYFGSADALQRANPEFPITTIADPADAVSITSTALPVFDLDMPGAAVAGVGNPANAGYVIESIDRAVALCQQGQAAALCTNPINKRILCEGGAFPYPGHTEYLAAKTGAASVAMMIVSDALRVVPATIHIPLRDVPQQLTQEKLSETIRLTDAGLRSLFGLKSPRIWVAGLNPHAGENGLIGSEEQTLIAPEIAAQRKSGIDVSGPFSADTMFHREARSKYDAAVCMYHDQALVPIKTLSFDSGVNITLGLPIIRTSPDHGTAFDIAGKGIARADSLIAAIRLAWQCASAQH